MGKAIEKEPKSLKRAKSKPAAKKQQGTVIFFGLLKGKITQDPVVLQRKMKDE